MLQQKIETISKDCTQCKKCQEQCGFLYKYGTPGEIAENYLSEKQKNNTIAFECSLCGLCVSVCPLSLDPAAMFLEMRWAAAKRGDVDFRQYARILEYERRGLSRRYTWYSLPEGCDTVFFPGCSFAGSHAEQTKKLYDYLKAENPAMGIVLDCCAKPSLETGRKDFFEDMLNEMVRFLSDNRVKHILVSCPSCYKVFKEFVSALSVETVYEYIARNGPANNVNQTGTVAIHDPCAVRFEKNIHDAVRSIIKESGLTIEETGNSGEKTVCCGEGGFTGDRTPEYAAKWKAMRMKDLNNRLVLTYCAGCESALRSSISICHIADVLFKPEKTWLIRAPFTYLNRINLKRKLKKTTESKTTRERCFLSEKDGYSLCWFQKIVKAVLG